MTKTSFTTVVVLSWTALALGIASAATETTASFLRHSSTPPPPPPSSRRQRWIGGAGNLLYEYDPSRLQTPPSAHIVNSHGFVVDANANNIYLTYETNNTLDPNHCIIQWHHDGSSPRLVNTTSSQLCAGTAHGLTIASEKGGDDDDNIEYLYHANNDQKLTKTFLNGTIVWQTVGPIDHDHDETQPYRPTWMAVPPTGPYIYLCDGYGSNFVYLMDRQSGKYLGQKWGGRGDAHGQFATNHGCVYDPVYDQIVVSDREHGRLEYYDYYNTRNNNTSRTYGAFDFSHSTDTRHGAWKKNTDARPCILRRQPQQNNLAAVADLTGAVQIVNESNAVVSVVNVSAILGHLGHSHPHDAQLLPNGDLIVATWNPGRVSYWRRIMDDLRIEQVK